MFFNIALNIFSIVRVANVDLLAVQVGILMGFIAPLLLLRFRGRRNIISTSYTVAQKGACLDLFC